jgi:hypothetical protein
MTEQGTTRGGILKRGLVLVAGAIGLGATAGAGTAATRQAPRHNGRFRLTAHLVELRGSADARYGILKDARGREAGHLYGTRVSMQSPFAGTEAAVTSLEQHTLVLDGGTIAAQGSLRGAKGQFFVLGGTGAYAGASGEYTLALGHGTAELALTISTKEAIHASSPD